MFPIETDRLTLRPLEMHDLEAVHAFQSLPEVARYMYWAPRDLAAVRTWLEGRVRVRELTEEGQALSLAVVRRDTGELIGECVLFWTSREHRQGEIGYTLHPGHHGHGFATEAARQLLRLGFDHYDLHRLVARADGRNKASARLMERLGLRKEAHLVQNEWVKGEWTDEIIYAMLQKEWRALQ
ncbi:GNAT family N-acetyltransferase [Acrocarpospora catenulata]|uniref:GNAT family N-acetyltransferase n=1 Tax=Acrocarpospora catenulata TaxID=2836182 RepID=UPI001BD9186F|nr:GNAT family N-acetyltransferase [Acrocarpospora catenulata]